MSMDAQSKPNNAHDSTSLEHLQDILNTPQRYQARQRQVHRELRVSIPDSPTRRRVPNENTRPHPPTITSLRLSSETTRGLEDAQTNSRAESQQSRNSDLLSGPRRRQPGAGNTTARQAFRLTEAGASSSTPPTSSATQPNVDKNANIDVFGNQLLLPTPPHSQRPVIEYEGSERAREAYARYIQDRELRTPTNTSLTRPRQTTQKAASTSGSVLGSNSEQLNTPPATQNPATNSAPNLPNKRSLAQRERREREKANRLANAQAPDDAENIPPAVPAVSRRSFSQKQRRERERAARGANQQLVPSVNRRRVELPTPPATPMDEAPRVRRQRTLARARMAQVEHEAPVQDGHNRSTRDSEQDAPNANDPVHHPRDRSPEREQQQEPHHDCDLPGPQHAFPFLAARLPYTDPPARHDLGRMDVECQHCGALHWLMESIVSGRNATPQFGTCCKHGEVQLPKLKDPPPVLRNLLEGDDRISKQFRENITQYNTALAFTSLRVDIDTSVNNGRGPPIFRIHGELCHQSGSLAPEIGRKPIYSQLYIYDPHVALQHRMDNNENLDRSVMEVLQNMMLRYNPYSGIYKHAYETLQEHADVPDYAIRLRVDPHQDQRCYNLPTANEVAVIIPGAEGAISEDRYKRDIVLRLREGPLHRIDEGHPSYAPLYYVLLFPHGEPGWHYEAQLNQPNKTDPGRLTQIRYFAYRLHDRAREFSALLRGGRLFQRYMVDMWACADQNRLTYLRLNQGNLRASLYSGLEDAMAAGDGEVDLNTLGQRYILPSSYIGGPRHMHQRFQDSMAIARFFRKVDLFVTVTANPSWPEVERELLPWQSPYDRPDLVSRVFQMKKQAIIEDIYKHGIFGLAVAYVYTIEFQKRGLPHMHLLIFLRDGYKLITINAIDSCIWARWPDPQEHPRLFETVKRCMIHGPCGLANPCAPCMENGRCTKHFPKPFQPYTNMDRDGYPNYYRPEGVAHEVNGLMIDNSWIVPYSPYLSAKYDCHINVENAVSISAFKYIFKYIHKGGDRATLEVQQPDKIQRFIDGRYVCASEAAWRILAFDVHDQVLNVERLQVHLPGQHMVTFNPNEDAALVLVRAAGEKTKLTEFFRANASPELGEEARKYTYQEFPQHFVWKNGKDKKCWALRQRGFALGQMFFVPPTGGEHFYLRTLLTVVKGPTSFEDLRTYNSAVYPTFRLACIARGLLEDDGEWHQCLTEAAVMQTGTSLRHLFASILVFCTPSDPGALWDEFRAHICDDLRYRLLGLNVNDPTDEEVYDYGLFLLDKILRESGKSLKDFDSMPEVEGDWGGMAWNPLMAEQTSYDRSRELTLANERIPSLNPEQRSAFEEIVGSALNGKGQHYFLTGSAGTGKTWVYNTICNKIRGEGGIVLCVASSGIAATLLAGGRTAHSVFRIPIESLNAESSCAIPKESQRADLIRATKLIIWDEITMAHRHTIEVLERTLRDICGEDGHLFGGITVVFGGDFKQILPVVPKGQREDIVDALLQWSKIWDGIKVLKLWRNMRLENHEEEREFAEWLVNVGNGATRTGEDLETFPVHMRAENYSSFCSSIFPGLDNPQVPPPDYFLNRLILAARNDHVDETNTYLLNTMAGQEQMFYSIDSVIEERGADPANDLPIPVEFLRTLKGSGMPYGELAIKIGCPLILLRNLSPGQGLCNGTRMVVTRVSGRVLETRIIGGDHDGEHAFIPRIHTFPSGTTADFSFKLKRVQFPVRLAFAISINKAQGQSVKHVGIDLRVPVFTHGQLYVALSQATSHNHIKILLPETEAVSQTLNIVYPEVLVDT